MAEQEMNGTKGKADGLDKNAMWIEKYRPKSLSDVAAHKEIITTSTLLVTLKATNHSKKFPLMSTIFTASFGNKLHDISGMRIFDCHLK